MIMQAALPYHFRLRTLTGLSPAILGKSGEIYYIGGTDVLPSPLSPEAEAEDVKALLTEEMESVMDLAVPLTAEAHAGRTWAEAKG